MLDHRRRENPPPIPAPGFDPHHTFAFSIQKTRTAKAAVRGTRYPLTPTSSRTSPLFGNNHGSDPSSGPRRLVRTPVAVHLLPWEKEKKVFLAAARRAPWRAGARPKTSFSLSEGRGWLAPRAFTSGRESGEGLLPRLFRHRPHRIDNLPHELVRVLQNHGVRNAQQSYAQSPQMIFFRGVPAHLIDLRMNAAIELNGQSVFEAVRNRGRRFQCGIDGEISRPGDNPEAVSTRPFRLPWGSVAVRELATWGFSRRRLYQCTPKAAEGQPAPTGGRGGGSDPSSGPRRLERTPVAVHLLPWEKENTVLSARARSKHLFPFRTPLRLSAAWVQPRKGYPFHRTGANAGFLAKSRSLRLCLFSPPA